MDEIISGVQVIKMYAWEKPFAKLIAHARSTELNELRKVSYIRGVFMTSMIFTSRFAMFCVMFSIVLIKGADQITAPTIFTITSYFSIVSFLMSQRFSRSVAEVAETYVGLKRLQKFFELDEKVTNRVKHEKNHNMNGNGFMEHVKEKNLGKLKKFYQELLYKNYFQLRYITQHIAMKLYRNADVSKCNRVHFNEKRSSPMDNAKQ